MKIKIKRFDKDIELPKYQTAGAAGFDLRARETIIIKPGQVGYVSLNITVATPRDHVFIITARGSTHKKGLIPANAIGVGDPDFCGDGDEYTFPLLNFTKKSVTIDRGDRIAQGMFVKFTRPQWGEVDKMNNKDRGAYGTTGNK